MIRTLTRKVSALALSPRPCPSLWDVARVRGLENRALQGRQATYTASVGASDEAPIPAATKVLPSRSCVR
jgi:hypothetical protein